MLDFTDPKHAHVDERLRKNLIVRAKEEIGVEVIA